MNVQCVFLLMLLGVLGEFTSKRPPELNTNDIDENNTLLYKNSPNITTLSPSSFSEFEEIAETTTNGKNRKTDQRSDAVTNGRIIFLSLSTTTKSLFVTDQSYSTSVSDSTTTEVVTTSTTEPSTTTKTPCPDNPKVNNLKVTPSSFNVSLKWDPPEIDDCVTNYVIYLDGNIKTNTTETEVTINDLVACNEYSIAVAISNEGNLGDEVTEYFNTTAPNPFGYAVSKIQFSENKTLRVTWTPPPDSVANCVTSYNVTWTDSTGIINDETSIPVIENSTELKIVGCVHYEVNILPIVNDNLSGPISKAFHDVTPLPTKPPNLVKKEADKTSVLLTWQTDNNTENMCQLEEILVNCTTIENTQKINGESTDFIFPMIMSGLSPFTNYSCVGLVKNKAGYSNSREFTFKTLEDVPSAPRNLHVEEVESSNFNVKWTKPEEIPGVMIAYGLIIFNNGPNFVPDDDCPKNEPSFWYSVPPNQTNYVFTKALPYHNYTIQVYGTDGAGNGSGAFTETITKAANPNNVKNVQVRYYYPTTEQYLGEAIVEYQSSCTNGPLYTYIIHYKGTREGFPDDEKTILANSLEAKFTIKPEREYTVDVTTYVEGNFFSTKTYSEPSTTKPGVPSLSSEGLKAPLANETNRAFFTLTRSAFTDTEGTVLYYALILLPKSVTLNQSYGFWDNENWPLLSNETQSRQLTRNFWNPFQDGKNEIVWVIDSLQDDTEYFLIVRALTSAAYRDSSPISFKTDIVDELNLGLILGLTFGLIAAGVIIAFIVFLYRKRRKEFFEEKEKPASVPTPGPISCKKFADYYAAVEENNSIIKNQYTAICNLSKELGLSTSYALLPENKRKNRYTNILPYDETRVKLQIDEDDEIGSDYINASYVKGYSNRIEYIATQGPLESTSKDFWKMVWQENVTIIVMVSQFIEQSKEKCFQYFPNNHEKMSFGESLEIRCSTELHFGTYCVRTLQLRKDEEQRNVYHMQFLEWPDFGVPQGTDNMLEFCHQIREKVLAEGGLIAIHCSAGVGRTGTLIALDILLQTIDHHRDINIYKTVLDLRKQRINMVQTEKQYMFIHTCVKEYLEMSTTQSKEQVQDRVYENMDVLRSSMKKNLLETEVESAL